MPASRLGPVQEGATTKNSKLEGVSANFRLNSLKKERVLFVDESLEAAAVRELAEETGIRLAALEQVGAFGDPGRDPRGHTVSVAFTSLLDTRAPAEAADDAARAGWYPAYDPPPLAFDHAKILGAALMKIRQIMAERT